MLDEEIAEAEIVNEVPEGVFDVRDGVEQGELVSIADAVRRVGLNEKTLRRWATKGSVRKKKLPNGKFLVDIEQVEVKARTEQVGNFDPKKIPAPEGSGQVRDTSGDSGGVGETSSSDSTDLEVREHVWSLVQRLTEVERLAAAAEKEAEMERDRRVAVEAAVEAERLKSESLQSEMRLMQETHRKELMAEAEARHAAELEAERTRSQGWFRRRKK